MTDARAERLWQLGGLPVLLRADATVRRYRLEKPALVARAVVDAERPRAVVGVASHSETRRHVQGECPMRVNCPRNGLAASCSSAVPSHER
eukprot:3270725-Prymnesium_polylepis.3